MKTNFCWSHLTSDVLPYLKQSMPVFHDWTEGVPETKSQENLERQERCRYPQMTQPDFLGPMLTWRYKWGLRDIFWHILPQNLPSAELKPPGIGFCWDLTADTQGASLWPISRLFVFNMKGRGLSRGGSRGGFCCCMPLPPKTSQLLGTATIQRWWRASAVKTSPTPTATSTSIFFKIHFQQRALVFCLDFTPSLSRAVTD